jgi:hypothetical protein
MPVPAAIELLIGGSFHQSGDVETLAERETEADASFNPQRQPRDQDRRYGMHAGVRCCQPDVQKPHRAHKRGRGGVDFQMHRLIGALASHRGEW